VKAKRVPVLATTTTAKAEDAGKIATQLVERKLAACVQIVEPITSVYRWQGKIESEQEILLLIKSTQDLIPDIAELLDEIHPYEVPELIATLIIGGSTSYLSWLEDSVQ
jgi:periplasmic divalent cation tolerance protein